MKVLLDTNIILDFALERQPWFLDSEEIISLAKQKQIKVYISASTISDIYYIIRKIKGKELAWEFLQNIISICQVANVDSRVIYMALNVNFKDFEDAIQYNSVVINQLDIIVTRNIKDFPISKPEIFTPSQFLEEISMNQ